MNMTDDGDDDAKVIGVPTGDPRFAHIKDLGDINPHTLKEIEHFFGTYKKVQGKEVEVRGFEDAAAARAAFDRSRELYTGKAK